MSDQGTVRNRIRKFRQDGLLNEFYLGVNPSLFGYKIAAMWFDVRPQSQKENLRREAALMKGTLLVCDYLSSRLSVVFCYRNEEDLKKTVQHITRMANSEDVVWQNKPFLPCDNSKLDSFRLGNHKQPATGRSMEEILQRCFKRNAPVDEDSEETSGKNG